MKLWQIGLIVFILAGAVNAVFLNFDLGGLPRAFRTPSGTFHPQ